MMKIKTKARIAIEAILDIATYGAERPVRLVDISTRQGVSQSYLEFLFKLLVRNGLLSGVRGPGGGYRLRRSLESVTVADIIAAVDADVFGRAIVPAAAYRSEHDGSIITTLWHDLDDYLHAYLRTVSLKALLSSTAASTDQQEHDATEITPPEALGAPCVRDNPRHDVRPLQTP